MTGRGCRLRRLPLALALTLGLLMSLLQCADCCSVFAADGTPRVSIAIDDNPTPDRPDQAMPGHSCHCLCHIGTPSAAVAIAPADLPLRMSAIAREQIPAALAGLPVFKPPRA